MSLPSFLKSGEVARLLPVTAETSKEARVASMLLAVLSSIPPFRSAMLATLGHRAGTRSDLDAFTEVVFKESPPNLGCRPDGLIVFEGGRGKTWTCLVEAKIGSAQLAPEQIEKYAALAKLNGVDAILTVSNQFVTVPSHSPVKLHSSALKGVALFHWSWMFVLTQSQLLVCEDGFEESAQKYILREFARHLDHPAVGVSKFDRMNSEWKDLVSKIHSGMVLSKNDPAVESSVAAWHQVTRDLSLLLSRKLRTLVKIAISKAHRDDQELRLREDSGTLLIEHKLYCTFIVPDAAAPMQVTADLLRRSLNVSMTLTAPRDKLRASARINWVLKQLSKSSPTGIQIRALWPGRASATQAPLSLLREKPELLEADNKTLSPTSFDVLMVRDLAGKFAGAKTFVEQVEELVPLFYKEIGEYVRAYVPLPPRIVTKKATEDSETDLAVTHESAGSSEDTPELDAEIDHALRSESAGLEILNTHQGNGDTEESNKVPIPATSSNPAQKDFSSSNPVTKQFEKEYEAPSPGAEPTVDGNTIANGSSNSTK